MDITHLVLHVFWPMVGTFYILLTVDLRADIKNLLTISSYTIMLKFPQAPPSQSGRIGPQVPGNGKIFHDTSILATIMALKQEHKHPQKGHRIAWDR